MVYLKKYFFHLVIMLSLSTLVSFSFEDNTGSSEIVLDVENIAIDILNPLKLYLHNSDGYFKEGDGLNVSVEILEISKKNIRKILGGGKMKHLKMIFTNLDTGEEFEVLSQDFAQTIKFGGGGATAGNYSIILTGTKRLTPMRIRMTKSYAEAPTEEERNAPYDMVRIETMFIGDHEEAKPIFNFPMQEGDRITATTSSALSIKFQRLSDGRSFNMPQADPLVAETSETWRLLYSLELPEDVKGFLNFRKGNKRFIDLTIKKYPYVAPTANGGSGIAGDGTGENGTNGSGAADGTPKNPLANLMEKMSEGSNNSGALMAEAISEMSKTLEEMNKKTFKNKPTYVTGSTPTVNEKIVVAPKNDLTAKSRFCRPIGIGKEGAYWAYWIGIGKEALEHYDKIQKQTLERNSKGTQTLVEHYATQITENVNKKGSHPSLGMIETNLVNAGEFVEYAIVNEINKDKFEKGKKYQAFRPSWAQRNVVVDHGNSSMPPEDLFLCLCNENKMSPLDVHFKYEVYNLEKVQL